MKASTVVVLSFLVMSAYCAVYNPYEDMARVDVTLHVIDEMGMPVHAVSAFIAMHDTPEHAKAVEGVTDALGNCRIHGESRAEAMGGLSKDGYYDATFKPDFRNLSLEETTRLRSWSDASVTNNLCIRKIRNPTKMYRHHVDFLQFPATNEVIKLDVETFEWCPPYGKGKHDDLHLVADVWRNPKVFSDFHYHLKVMFPNCMDGFYFANREGTSAFPFCYNADTNSVYNTEFELRHVLTTNGITESVKIPDDKYIVFRVRTATNDVGQIIHANYGRIHKLKQVLGLSATTWFNPSDMDTNLESSEFADAQRKRDNRNKARSRRHLRTTDDRLLREAKE